MPDADPDPSAEWWAVRDVAAYLRVARSTVYAYVSRGQMPTPEQRYGSADLWRPATIITWSAGRRHGKRSD